MSCVNGILVNVDSVTQHRTRVPAISGYDCRFNFKPASVQQWLIWRYIFLIFDLLWIINWLPGELCAHVEIGSVIVPGFQFARLFVISSRVKTIVARRRKRGVGFPLHVDGETAAAVGFRVARYGVDSIRKCSFGRIFRRIYRS